MKIVGIILIVISILGFLCVYLSMDKNKLHRYKKMFYSILFHKREILEGWKNFYFRRVDIEEVADVRRAICELNKCGQYNPKGIYISCDDCGCPIEKKIRSLRTPCPHELWGHVNELQLTISPTLFDKSDFYVETADKEYKYYRHKKHPNVVIRMNKKTNEYNNGEQEFLYWKDIEDYFKEKTGKNLN